LSSLFARGSALVSQNKTGILTAVGVLGTISTAYLTGKATVKAIDKIQAEQQKRHEEFEPGKGHEHPELTNRDKLSLTWTEYIIPVGVGSATILAIIFANRLASKEAAALAAAYGLSERAFTEYKEKVIERLGAEKEKSEIVDEVAKDRIAKNPPGTTVIIEGQGNVLCYDMWTGRYFESSAEKIRRAVNAVNYEINQGMYISASTFYDDLGMEATTMTDQMGWNLNRKLDVDFSTHKTQDERPALAMSITPPIAEYRDLY
jgi:hypothetical protein